MKVIETRLGGLYIIHPKVFEDKRGYFFELTKEEFKILTSSDCYYCGQNPNQLHNTNKNKFNGNYIHNGVDRVDNSKGYIINNCVACCWKCNKMKGSWTQEEFINHCKKIAKGRKF